MKRRGIVNVLTMALIIVIAIIAIVVVYNVSKVLVSEEVESIEERYEELVTDMLTVEDMLSGQEEEGLGDPQDGGEESALSYEPPCGNGACTAGETFVLQSPGNPVLNFSFAGYDYFINLLGVSSSTTILLRVCNPESCEDRELTEGQAYIIAGLPIFVEDVLYSPVGSSLVALYFGEDERTCQADCDSSGQDVVYVDSCQALTQPDTTYVLSANLTGTPTTLSEVIGYDRGLNPIYMTSTCIKVEAENVVLDCGGHGVSGTIGSNSGIFSDKAATTIKNCNIGGTYAGIYLTRDSKNSYIYHNVLSGNKNGLVLRHGEGTRVVVDNNIMISNSYYGIYQYRTGKYWRCPARESVNTITNNVISDNGRSGFYLYGSNNLVKGNTIKRNSWKGVYTYGSKNSYEVNEVSDNEGIGLYFAGGLASQTYVCKSLNGNKITENRVCHNAESVSGYWNNYDMRIIGEPQISEFSINTCDKTNYQNCSKTCDDYNLDRSVEQVSDNSYEVTLTVDSNPSVTDYIITEKFPYGWYVASASYCDEISGCVGADNIVWIASEGTELLPGEDVEIKYEIANPGSIRDDLGSTFDGSWSTLDSQGKVWGVKSIW